MNNDRMVDVGTMLNSIADQLSETQGNLNQFDDDPRGGTHGDRMAQAFRTAAQAAQQSRTDDAGEQLRIAADVMRQRGQGKAAGYYADGLDEAAQQFGGQSGISLSSLAPFLQAILGGVQRNNPAQPGQGTMIDALGPAVGAIMGNRGQDPRAGALSALAEAVMGARGTANQRGRIDPGAASATGVIGGIVSALLPGILGQIMGRMGQGGGGRQQPQMDMMPQRPVNAPVGSRGGQDDSGFGLDDLLGQVMGGGNSGRSQGGYETGGGSPLGGLGGGLGDILGKLVSPGGGAPQQPSQQQSGGKPVWWPF